MIDSNKVNMEMRWIHNFKSGLQNSRTYKVLRWDLKDRVIWKGKNKKDVDIAESSFFINFLKMSYVYKIVVNLFKEREIK